MRSLLLTAALLINTGVHAAPSKILFGSCAHQDKAMPILASINQEQADLFIFLGDNIYGDTRDMTELQAKYDKLAANSGFQQLRQSTKVVATWDDHDFGENDAGAEYPQKAQSKQIMLDFWREPKDSPRYQQSGGIYTSYLLGQGDNTIQVILLDLRYNREPINRVSDSDYLTKRKPNNMGPYAPSNDPNASMLGQVQWQWLEQQLRKPAKIRLIGSSLQLLPEFTGWESWANYPADRKRLLNLIKQQQINGVMILSGDTHWGELSKYQQDMPYPLWEVTSSGLTEKWKQVSPNKHRIGNYSHEVNYGFLQIDWQQPDPAISFGLKNSEGKVINATEFPLSQIRPF